MPISTEEKLDTLKLKLRTALVESVQSSALTQPELDRRLGAEAKYLRRAMHHSCSLPRYLSMLTALGHDIDIVIAPLQQQSEPEAAA